LLYIIINIFEGLGNLTSWEKRAFNTLAILCSSLISLSLGSLMEVLGNMARWPLLAMQSQDNNPADVDVILGMARPTGALSLVWQRTRRRKKPATTLIAALYLVFNVVLRLSVAFVGLTYNLNERPEIEYPVKMADWSFALPPNEPDQEEGMWWSDWASAGLFLFPTRFNMTNNATRALTELKVPRLNRKVEEKSVTYSYRLKEHIGPQTSHSKTFSVHSTSRC
ncbi:hypothetical protein B0H67DRAFT_451006, partial [Lasiosphaeris hirsuta]